MTLRLEDEPSKFESIACEARSALRRFSAAANPEDLARLASDWVCTARRGQLPPDGPWRTWVMLGGRGAGKTRAGAEWVRRQVAAGRCGRIALAGPSLHEVREVMIEGASGLRNLGGERPVYEATRRRLLWACGAQAHVISARDPDNFRGPQFDAAWADELCVWPHAEETLATLRLGLRLGPAPRLVVTTTPRPIAALTRLLDEPDTIAWRVPTASNRANLAPGFAAAMAARWAGTFYGRQELEGELVEDPQGALWTRAALDAAQAQAWPKPDRVVVAVDPPAGVGPRADACGIVVAGAYGADPVRSVVLADASVQGLGPADWAARVAAQAALHGAIIVAEANNGGEMVRTILRAAAPGAAVRLVRARQGKRERALSVAALYETGRVVHAGRFRALEDEMCTFGAPGFSGSPDRLDALVWAITDLLIDQPAPRVKAL